MRIETIAVQQPEPLASTLAELHAGGIAVETEVALSETTYLRTGGSAAAIVTPAGVGQLVEAAALLQARRIPFKIIGATSNLIFLDDADYGVLVSTVRLSAMRFDDAHGEIVAETGAMLPDVTRFALLHSVTGLEGLEGVPGTLGGAVYMNAGAYGDEIKDTLIAVDALHADGTIERIDAAALRLGHRTSAIRERSLDVTVLRCFFRATPGDAAAIEGRMELFHAKRHKYQDFLFPNLGSIFSASPYRALGQRDRYFHLMSMLHYGLAYRFKPFRRESPLNRKWLNDLAVRRFGFDYAIQPFSNKTLNCLVNRGQGTSEMVRYIEDIQRLAGGALPLENEIVKPF